MKKIIYFLLLALVSASAYAITVTIKSENFNLNGATIREEGGRGLKFTLPGCSVNECHSVSLQLLEYQPKEEASANIFVKLPEDESNHQYLGTLNLFWTHVNGRTIYNIKKSFIGIYGYQYKMTPRPCTDQDCEIIISKDPDKSDTIS